MSQQALNWQHDEIKTRRRLEREAQMRESDRQARERNRRHGR